MIMLSDINETGGMEIDELRAGFTLACSTLSCSLGSRQEMPTNSVIIADDGVDNLILISDKKVT
jgi:hypothetical protein